MSALEIAVALLRGTHVAALISLFGTLMFLTIVLPAAETEGTLEASIVRRRLLRFARICAVFALIVGFAWLTMESAVIAGVDSAARTSHALIVVAWRTQFGQWLLVRGALLLLVLPALRPTRAGNVAAAVVAGLALAVQPMIGHAGAVGGTAGVTLIVSEILHLLAAGAWLGGLAPLFLTIGTLHPPAAATACRNFTPVGMAAVLLLAGTATVQVARFMGGAVGLLGTGYGHIALIKFGLFIVLLGLAVVNRLALTDRLAGTQGDAARRHMRISVGVEMVVGVLVVITAGFLASHAPGTHEQPVWPFAMRPDLLIFAEPGSRGAVIAALVATGGAILIATGGLIRRKLRWPALLTAAIIVALAMPRLGPLFVAAYPSTFHTSPTDFSVTAIAHGAKLYEAHCVSCHGPEGRGDGPAAKFLPVRPADLAAAHFIAHPEGDLYWFIAHGIDGPTGQPAMPGFSGTISSDGIWTLLDYLRARHAGLTTRTGMLTGEPVSVPRFDAVCADGTTVELADFRGRVIRILAMPDRAPTPLEPPPVEGVDSRTILLVRHPPATAAGATCVTVEPEAWTAFAILLGVTPDELTGTEILADAELSLRAFWRPGNAGTWSSERQAEIIRDIVAHPLSPAAGDRAHRH